MKKMLRKIGIRQKIIFGVGLLVMIALVFQGGILWYFVLKEIKKNVTEKLSRETRKKAGLLNDTVALVGEDMEIIQAHKSIEDYFTSHAFEDADGMTDAVAGIEPFFSRIYKAKPQYARMQITTAQGSGVLQIVNGKRIEKHEQHDIALAIEKTSTGEIMHNAVSNDETGWIIQSVSALVFENKTEGLLWLSLSVDELLNKKYWKT
ncbi:MAG: hypothetical protein GY749_07645 [Desulfobacteraceae bacterium]|nr:hypothetical protein [Desulfobacteraceae bacterium]